MDAVMIEAGPGRSNRERRREGSKLERPRESVNVGRNSFFLDIIVT